ncbi:hypothetical protein AM493_09265 [Flavobacterium akiainvivens]|uniref:Uncharacterized protein n=1 Tax=Flavobacterium akiainvivens TaxID=1202724 RepID=A0A0M8MIE7_9FLAO|nr:hypothetical protein [Flavobacterium akiainvivens]KOS06198.1 hypothetical protein AM493_09265 [Flavobacterium akiainvivens]SFQ68474.1 hypothetical protein SAMN05444144_11487 [Flavobacterium akiainvivens]
MTTPQTKYKLDFYSSHNQFYIFDKNCNYDTGSADFWTEEAFVQQMAVSPCGVGVGTYSYGYVRGEVELFNAAQPIRDLAGFDHVVEAGFTITSGALEVMGCMNFDDTVSIEIPNNTYRVRVYGSNFSSVIETDLDHNTDNDFYRVEIWPDTNTERKVFKQHDGGY